MIRYEDTADGIEPRQLRGFFEGWPNPPSPETHLAILRGIARRLVTRLVDRLGDLYMVDLVCDPELLPFYERLGFRPGSAAIIRRMSRQAGA